MIARICWLLLALIHAVPAMALFRPGLIEQLYAVGPASGGHTLLVHRAAMFLVMAIICVWAAWRVEVRALATVAVGISMATFIMVWWQAGQPAPLTNIAIADALGLAILALAGWSTWRN